MHSIIFKIVVSKRIELSDRHPDKFNFEEHVEENLYEAVRKQREPRSTVTGSVEDIVRVRYNWHTLEKGDP